MRKFLIIGLIPIAILLLIVFYFYWGSVPEAEEINWGVSFSRTRAMNLRLHWKETYIAILDELRPKHIRLTAHWPTIEESPGVYDFKHLDWQMTEAVKRNIKIVLVVGRRIPGWPECHVPDWAKDLSEKEQQKKVLLLVEKTIDRYKLAKHIWAWQVENEPFFKSFGECPKADEEFLDAEIALVRSLDDRPIILTDSGEWGRWTKLGEKADILGISMYRAVWNKIFGYVFYPLRPIFYHRKAELTQLFIGKKRIIVTELQAEPWAQEELKETPLKEQFKTLSPELFLENIDYARRSGYSFFYLWGAEWWHWLKEQQEKDEIWNEAKKLFAQ